MKRIVRIRRNGHRQAVIDACRLIGYTIEPASNHFGPYMKERYRYIVLNRVGNALRTAAKLSPTGRSLTGQNVRTFRFMWQAAVAALEDAGVDIDALKPPRKAGDGSRSERAIPRQGN